MHESSRSLELNTSGTRHDVRRLFFEHHDRLLSSPRIIGTFILPVIVFLFVGFSPLHPFHVFRHDECDRVTSINNQGKRMRMTLFITVYWYYWIGWTSGLGISRRQPSGIGVKTVQSILWEIDDVYYLRSRNMAVFALNVLLWKRKQSVRISIYTTLAHWRASNNSLRAKLQRSVRN